MQNKYNKIYAAQIGLGEVYSSPLFFNDGVNMFLAGGKTVKEYHLKAIKQWCLDYFLCEGHKLMSVEEYIEPCDECELEEL